MANEKKQTFLGGAAVLAFGIVVVKVIGAVFKIPLRNILGEAGSADFSNAYNIYATFLTVSTAGLPVALSKMVSEAGALGRRKQAQRVFSISFAVFLTLGLLSFAFMWWGNDYLAAALNNPRAAYGIRALAPAVVCVGCLSAFRGYAQGRFNMQPTAVSQILEALCKLFVGLALAMYLLSIGQPDYIAAAGAITGVTVGTILALVYMALNYLRHRERVEGEELCAGRSELFARLLSLAVPITLSSSMVSIITLIDTSLVQGQLQDALGLALNETRRLYGNYSACMDLYNLPSSLMVALTASVIPAVSAARARHDEEHTERVINAAFRVTAILAFPMGFGLFALSEPIFRLFYSGYDGTLGGELLAVLGIASIFVCLMLVANSVLQAYGKVHIPIVTMLIGGILKITLNYNLVAIPSVNIHGAPIGTLACFAFVALANLYFVARFSKTRLRYASFFAKPLVASALMVLTARGVFALAARFVSFGCARLTLLVCVAVAVGAAVIVYFALVLALRIITRDDLQLLPKGEMLGKLLKIR
ncbi:MAG: polysaccharide biosynthesis protein [Oscillospiraceae bacterium]|nr:polysaccharide biosynthesis protein [Oscillospiraceae bacterium]